MVSLSDLVQLQSEKYQNSNGLANMIRKLILMHNNRMLGRVPQHSHPGENVGRVSHNVLQYY